MSARYVFPALVVCALFPAITTGAPAAPPSASTCRNIAGQVENSEETLAASRDKLEACLTRTDLDTSLRASISSILSGATIPPAVEAPLVATDLAAAQALARRAYDGSPATGHDAYSADASRATLKAPTVKKGGLGGVLEAPVPDEVVEFFAVLADVAVKRAKRNGLVYLQDRLASTVCGVKIDASIKISFMKKAWRTGKTASAGDPLFPDTCTLLRTTPLERIASEPEALAAAVTSDLTHVLAEHMIVRLNLGGEHARTLRQFLQLARGVAARVLQTKNFSLQASEVNLVVDAILQDHLTGKTTWRNKAVAVGVGGLGYAISLAKGELAALAATDVPGLIDELCPLNGAALTCTIEEQLEASALTSLGIKAIAAVDSTGKGDTLARAKASIQFLFELARTAEVSKDVDATLGHLEALLLASIDRDIPRALASAARYLESLLNGECAEACHESRYDVEELVTLLSSIATYSSTYIKPTEGKTAPTTEELRAARTAAVESAIAAFTNRNRRHGAWVGSLGLPVGFSMGGQSFRVEDPETDRPGLLLPEAMPPQLSLPLGLAIQRLPGYHHRRGKRPDGRFFFDGFHAMATVFDLGQFVAYDARGELNKPTWSSFMSLGGQLGWLIGSPANAFVVAADVRYAPSLFKTGDGTMPGDQLGGALRFGLFVAYHVSLFDFN